VAITDRIKSVLGGNNSSPVKEDKNFMEEASLEEKIARSKEILKAAYERFPHDKIILAWTGGKDSTFILWLMKEVCQENDYPLPRTMFINEGDIFKETLDFVEQWSGEWGVAVDFVQNDDVLKQVKKLGDPVYVNKLDEKNRAELARLDFKKESFPFEPESLVGNHLMKTAAMNRYLEKMEVAAYITGIRWDEQEARAEETYFSPRENPRHTRIHPILHFKEKDVWDATHRHKIPYVKLYEEGYRSLGAKITTVKPSEKPAWEQDLEKTTERVGRRQDKEQIMKRLRDLGYM
jgi:phosphoadenosine phosphosulfate reductase